MARKAINPGVGRGKGVRTEKECRCIDCGLAFTAKRSDALRCPTCREGRDRKHRQRPRPERTKGVREFTCVDCEGSFTAIRIAQRCEPCQRARRRSLERAGERIRKYDTCPLCNGRKAKANRHCNRCRIGFLRSDANRGLGNPNWKGGRTEKDGYILLRNPDRKRRKYNYVAEHILVWEAAHGPVPRNGHVHHLNGQKQDNRLENLAWLSMSDHHSSKGYEPYKARIRELEAQLTNILDGSRPS